MNEHLLVISYMPGIHLQPFRPNYYSALFFFTAFSNIEGSSISRNCLPLNPETFHFKPSAHKNPLSYSNRMLPPPNKSIPTSSTQTSTTAFLKRFPHAPRFRWPGYLGATDDSEARQIAGVHNTYTYTYIHTYIHAFIHAYIHILQGIYLHIHTQTNDIPNIINYSGDPQK